MANWIWYPGDFEIYHGKCQNFDREEREFFWPAYWRVDDCRHNVKFIKEVKFDKADARFCVHAQGIGHVCIHWKPEELKGQDVLPYMYKEKKFPFGREIVSPAQEISVEIIVGNLEGLPTVYVDGDLESDSSWMATEYSLEPVKAGWNCMYTRPDQNPMVFEYTSRRMDPVCKENVNGGILYDFGREITADTIVEFTEDDKNFTLCYGESKAEALDTEYGYYIHRLSKDMKDSMIGKWESAQIYRTKLRGFRYIFIPDSDGSGIKLTADYKYVDFPDRGHFSCDDQRMNEIWAVGNKTFRLASGIFFLDGVKRDRWIWSGDAYQSYLINRYLFFDADICKRTILALRGNDPITQHINTIMDYSMYWIMSIGSYYEMTKDYDFIEMVYPKMKSMMEYCMAQTDENGFIYGRPGDWVFIDWANMDKEGPISGEQMLLAQCYQAMIDVHSLLGLDNTMYVEKKKTLLENIRKYYWDSEKGAFIDGYESGRRNVTRHSNIFAVLFDFVTREETESILQNVLLNDQIEAITTPYFKFYELEALSKLGQFEEVICRIKDYWGGMLDRGADTFWEEYNPNDTVEEQYDMYGKKFGKSLCHAWGASPIYLIGRYFMGVRPTSAGYATFEVKPQTGIFGSFECTLPVGEGNVSVKCENGTLLVQADRDGGTLVYNGQTIPLDKDKAMEIKI